MTDATNPSAKTGEPVAWLSTDDFGDQSATPNMDTMLDWRRYGRAITPLYTHPQPSLSVGLDREAVARIIVDGTGAGTLGPTNDASMQAAYPLADAILALAAPAEGYVLVPVEPTEAMLRAFWQTHFSEGSKSDADCYRAMIAACLPAAPTGGRK